MSLVHNKGLVKTVQFRNPKYVGDPINAVKIFNEKEVDELMVLDIDATTEKREPNYQMIESLANECRMPLCYGGGIKTVEQAQRVFSCSGVEKIALSSAAIENPRLLTEISETVGSQSVVVVLDIKKRSITGKYEVHIYNGKKNTGKDPARLASDLEKLGIGELVINSIDRDGMMNGYDLKLVEKIRDTINLPMSVLGGAGSMEDIGRLIEQFGIIGAAAGSLFVFKGIYKAVLISYPNPQTKDHLIQANMISKNHV